MQNQSPNKSTNPKETIVATLLDKLEKAFDKEQALKEQETTLRKIKKILKEKRELTKENILLSIGVVAMYLILTILANLSLASVPFIMTILSICGLVSLSIIQIVYHKEKNKLQEELKQYGHTFSSAKKITSKENIKKMSNEYMEVVEEISEIKTKINKQHRTSPPKRFVATPNPTIEINRTLTREVTK